ncbi:glycosyltransferase family 2 protein [uncultured Pelagimonas sp.]|uniref:glycosyltransferase family 2 protein n=1 Tax=uncultured Pelagimonas sp. TaxID=1618102 RepID=UPI002616BF93|nr:glycosyltransferase family 2 protein [uncultured Pelagimonas sp.]
MRISVVIPTYNRCDFLLACLETVFSQQRLPDEVIVVDDGSNDGTREALAMRKDVTFIEQDNAGPGAARNRGAAAATGDYLAFLDSDDLWFPWSLRVMVDLAKDHDHPALLFGSFKDFGTSAPADLSQTPTKAKVFDTYLSSAEHGFFAGAGMMMIRRDAFLKAGGFTEDRLNAEDHDLALRLGTAAGFAQITAPITVAHRIHDGNEMGNDALNLDGLKRLVAHEKAGVYPGGAAWSRSRRLILTGHVRAAVISCARSGRWASGWGLYRDTFLWNIVQKRLAYVAGAPVLALQALVTRRKETSHE